MKYIYNVEVTIRKKNDSGQYIESEPWELSNDGLRNAIRRVERELRRIEALKISAIECGEYERAKVLRREQEPLRNRLYNLIVEEEFRLGN